MPFLRPPLRSLALAALLIACGTQARECAPYIEERGNESAATLRPHTHALIRCEVDEAAFRRLVTEWLRGRSAAAPAPRSLALGRAVAYPWISEHITAAAAADAQWRALAARTPRTRRDALLGRLLEDPSLRARLAAPLAGSGYKLAGVSYEKVLWNEEGLPFDAQLWLRLAPR